MSTMFDPIAVDTELLVIYANMIEELKAVAVMRGDYTRDGAQSAYARRITQPLNRLAALKKTIEAGREGLNAIEAAAYDTLVPHRLDKADTADEMKFQRLINRVTDERDTPIRALKAGEILAANLGTSFAALWVEEMEARGIMDGDAVRNVLGSENAMYRQAVELQSLGVTVFMNCLYPLIETLEKLAVLNPLDMPMAPNNGVPVPMIPREVSLDFQVRVSAILAPCKWSTDGKKWTANMPVSAAAAKAQEQARELSVKIDGLTHVTVNGETVDLRNLGDVAAAESTGDGRRATVGVEEE